MAAKPHTWGRWRRPRSRWHGGVVGWSMGHSAPGYRLSVVRQGFHGRPCVELAAVNAPAGSWQCLVQNIHAAHYRGKRVTLSGWMKTADVDDVTFGVRVDSASKPAAVASEQVSGTTDWKQYSLTFDVPSDTRTLAVTPGNLGSRGSLWLTNVHVDVAGGQQAIAAPDSSRQPQFHYAGDTTRVVHIWMLSRQGKKTEALAQAEAIAADATATKEERCTATEGVAVLAWMLGKTDEANKALADFDTQSKDLNIDPGVVAEANRTRDRMNEQTKVYVPPPAPVLPAEVPAPPSTPEATVDNRRWHNANGNDWTTASTTPRNLAFASGLTGWEKGADYSAAPDYVSGMRRGAYHGHMTAVLESKTARPKGNAVLCQWVRADNYLGKRVRISAMLQLRALHTTRGSLFAHLDTRDDYSYWDGLPGLTATSQWRRCSLVIDIPADAQGIIFGGSLTGRGTLLIADVKVEAVDKSVPLTSGGVTQ